VVVTISQTVPWYLPGGSEEDDEEKRYLTHESHSLGRDMNTVPPETEAGMAVTQWESSVPSLMYLAVHLDKLLVMRSNLLHPLKY
jgi:hypothetical protein